jgi:hypothetical protein
VDTHLAIIESRADEGDAASEQRKIVQGFSSLSRRDLSDVVPKGRQDSARGFNPWRRVHAKTRSEGAEDIRDRRVVWTISVYRKRRFYRTLRGGHRFNRHLGLKPQAESFSPFRTQDRGELESNTPILHYSAPQELRTRTSTKWPVRLTEPHALDSCRTWATRR